MTDWFAHKKKEKKKKRKKKGVMLETKATLKTMEKLFAKRIATFVCLLGWKQKFKFKTKKKKKNTTTSLRKSTFRSNLFCKLDTIKNLNIHYCDILCLLKQTWCKAKH